MDMTDLIPKSTTTSTTGLFEEEDPFSADINHSISYIGNHPTRHPNIRELLHRYFCREYGFEYNEPGFFSKWIPYYKCPHGDRCQYASPWTPPLSDYEWQLIVKKVAQRRDMLIDKARQEEMMRRSK